jgi:tripartite-type tricarboxylate transporter receptor subunit TctC
MATFELSTMHWMGISQLTHEDFEPVIQLNADAAAILVRADAPWSSLSELLDYIKANPGELKMSGTATGGAWDLARAGFQVAAGLPVESVLWVPTKGSAPSLVELLGGHIDAVCCSVPEAASQIEAGQLRVLAVMSPERLPDAPDAPTVKEAGIDWEAVGWRGLAVPRNTPQAIVEVLAKHALEIVESKEYQDFMRKNGFAIEVRGPEEFREFLAVQDAQWQSVIQAAGYAQP